MFEFNGSYDDYEQVAEFIGEFARIRQEIVDAGRYPYNADFEGRIPGIANTAKRGPSVGTHEEAAIYMLQGLLRAWELEARVIDLLAEGFEYVDSLAETTRFRRVVLYPDGRRMNGEWAEFEGARLVPEERAEQAGITGPVRAVLPKGKRTHGHYVNGRRVLALR